MWRSYVHRVWAIISMVWRAQPSQAGVVVVATLCMVCCVAVKVCSKAELMSACLPAFSDTLQFDQLIFTGDQQQHQQLCSAKSVHVTLSLYTMR